MLFFVIAISLISFSIWWASVSLAQEDHEHPEMSHVTSHSVLPLPVGIATQSHRWMCQWCRRLRRWWKFLRYNISIKWWTSQCKNRPGVNSKSWVWITEVRLPCFDSPNLPGLEQVNVPMITQVEKIVEIPQVEHLGLTVGGWLFKNKTVWNLKTQVFRFLQRQT